MSTVRIYRVNNNLKPEDRAQMQKLREALRRASDQMDENDDAKYKAAYEKAKSDYDAYLEKATR